MTLTTLLAIGSGGFIGAVCRAYINGLANSAFSSSLIPIGTLSVNIIGSFFIGILFFHFSNSDFFSPHTKSFLSTGILGGLTTFSTFSLETFILFQSTPLVAFLNIGLNLSISLIATFVGFKLATLLHSIF